MTRTRDMIRSTGPSILTADHEHVDETREAPPFKRVVCWDPTRVTKIMDTEALQTAPEVFMAAHSPIPLLRSDLRGEGTQDSAVRPYSESEFLRDFCATEDFSFVAIIGGAGTGKSHLVRWMAHQLKSSSSRRVLLIPRAGTSLHEVLRRLLEGLEGERFEEYRRRLNATDNAITAPVARERLLDDLARTLRHEGTRLQSEAKTEDEELEAHLASELPNLLSDPVLRGHFLNEGGVLDKLARQVIGENTVDRVEERRGFAASDLPLRFRAINSASTLAQGIYRLLVGNEQLVERAVACLNRYLDDAVAQLVQMGGTDLLRLMRDVRVELARHSIELIVLIEDLAMLQGLDQQLLEALIVRPKQEGMEQLCALRSAVAMNRGYFDGLRSTVRQRFDFRVVMGDGDARNNASEQDIVAFTGRYLNAIRLHPQILRRWHEEQQETHGAATSSAPSACEECPFRKPCHAAFGESEGYGLYPFNDTAVQTISTRVSPVGFNPRIQLKDGYKPVLENYVEDLREGQFPPKALQERFGKSGLTARVVAELKALDSRDFPRREALLDIWGGSPETLIDLDPGIHAAFELTLLTKGGSRPAPRAPSTEIAPPTLVSTPSPQISAAEKVLQSQQAELDRWRAGEVMSQDLMQALRAVVFPAVVTSIDWNSLHLIQGEFAGGTAPFRKDRSINFVGQILPIQTAAIQLVLPLSGDDITDTAIALQGLLLLKHHRSWQFADGHFYYRTYLRQVERWAAHVVAQIDRLPNGETWNPVPVATELLAVGARLHGLPANRAPETSDVAAALFQDLPERDDSDRSAAWASLTARFHSRRKTITEALLARIACSKGKSREIQVIDVARLFPTLTSVRRGEYPDPAIPPTFRTARVNSWERAVDECGADLGAKLSAAVVSEKDHQIARFERVAEALGLAADAAGDDVTARRQETLAAVQSLLSEAASAGVIAGRARKEALDEASGPFERAQLVRWADVMRRVREAPDEATLLSELSIVPMNTGATAIRFITAADDLLGDVERFLAAGTDRGSSGIDRMRDVQAAIAAGLSDLDEMLAAITGGEA